MKSEAVLIDKKMDEMKRQKVWRGILIFGLVLIVVLAITIISLAITRNNSGGQSSVEYNDEAFKSYEEYVNEIKQKVSEANETGDTQSMLTLYQEYVANAGDERTKALLQNDYYMLIMTSDTARERASEVINGLISVDSVLKTQASALAVLNAAYYYNDTEVTNRYMNVLKERGFTGNVGSLDDVPQTNSSDNVSADEDTVNETTEDEKWRVDNPDDDHDITIIPTDDKGDDKDED